MKIYSLWCPELGEEESDADTYPADSIYEAAGAWADRHDAYSAEYDIVGGRFSPVVHIRDENGTVKTFRVDGEAVPLYTAHEVKL